MPETTTPAMDGRDWANYGFCRPGFNVNWLEAAWLDSDGLHIRGDVRTYSPILRIEGHKTVRMQVSDDDRHALAALALHRQPFGFTVDDLSILNVAADSAYAAGANTEGDALRSLADRVEALLPPPEPEVWTNDAGGSDAR
jgi:hypothetical protein